MLQTISNVSLPGPSGKVWRDAPNAIEAKQGKLYAHSFGINAPAVPVGRSARPLCM